MIKINTSGWGRTGLVVLALVVPSSKLDAEILSSKRGFADSSANYNNLQATGAGWYYTWGSSPGTPGNFDAKFYPMFWNAPSQTTITSVKGRNADYVLGFNEPERSDQANMTVDAAVGSWSTISNSFVGATTKLVSPAVSDTTDGRAWLSSFMTELNARKTNPQNANYNPNLRVDAVAFHWYGVSTPDNPAAAASSFLGSVDLYHNTYGLPVFITEFAIHDWGNNYTDAQIIEANRQFLNIVVPALDSRSYVAGYSWYHWFSDAHLYDSSPSKPTSMAYSYVGGVGTGQVADIGGQNLGEHAAYLTGGELTMTGATAGTVRYINALDNASTISGGLDWGLNTSTNWIRIQPGASLRKSGANQITFGAGTVTNDGALVVSQGTLRLGVSVVGNGTVEVKGGTLALTGAGRLNTAPSIDVRAGGTYDVSGAAGTYNVTSGQTLSNDGIVVGNVTAASGSMFAGGGTLAGNLTALAGATIRVGKDGAGVPRRFIIDNFESYAVGDVRTTASPPWTAHQDTTLADIEDYNGNNVLTYGWASDFRGVSRTLPQSAVIDNSTTATFFFRINSKTASPNHSFGLGDQASTGTVDFSDYETQLRVKQGTNANTIALDARNAGGFTATLANNLALNTWYNIWMVVNQSTDTYDVYMNTGTSAAILANKLNATPLSFRNGTARSLNTVLALAGAAPIDNGVRVDDLVYLSGADLTNPVAGFDSGLVWTPETLTVNGDFIQNAGSVLQLNLLDPSHRDSLHVTGNASFGGTLDVSFAFGAPTPNPGDAFDILDFGLASGLFSTLNLPSLPMGLAWNTSQLISTGVLKVGLVGDYNDDGKVDGADYVVWRKSGVNGQQGYLDWRGNFGQSAGSGSSSIVTVPEPRTLMLLGGLVALATVISNRSRLRTNGLFE